MGNATMKTRHIQKVENSTSFYLENDRLVTSPATSGPSRHQQAEISFPGSAVPGIPGSNDTLLPETDEDAFTQAVLSFCAHMKGRMDALDNARLYEEFCSYAATHSTHAAAHSPNMGVA